MKNSLNKKLTLSTVIVLALMPVALLANQITLTQNSNYSSDDGGEFTAATTGQSFLGNGYVAATEVNGGFETFCVESSVYFYQNTSYNYTLSSTTDSDGQALTEGAAFLYYQFATGQLSGYNYTAGSGRSTTAGQLQAAIWYLMGGQLGDGFTSTSILSDPYYQLALSTLGSNGINAANNGVYGVDLLELTDSNGDPAQNQLVLTCGQSVPDNFTTVIAFGASLGGLFLAHAQRRQLATRRI